MQRNDISVILACFNGAKYIGKQLDSMLNQTVLPAEIIVCDDNSTDGTVAILQGYLANSLIKLIVNKEQLGLVQNFKQAAGLVQQGNRIIFADQDDIWVPQKIEQLLGEMSLIDDGITPALIYTDLTVIDKNDSVIAQSFWERQKINPEKINLARLLYGNVVTGCTMIINYAMAREFLSMDDYTYFHDEWLALIAYTFGKAKFLTDKLILYRQHESNATFAEGYEPDTENSLKSIVNYLTGKQTFLPHQFALAKAFLTKYRNRLTAGQIEIFDKFIAQENKNYLLQRINRRITYL